MSVIRHFFSTMAGRLFLTLVLGMCTAAVLATLLAEAKRQQDADRQNMVRLSDRLIGYVDLLENSPSELRARLIELGGPGIRHIASDTPISAVVMDPDFAALLIAQNKLISPNVRIAPETHCRPPLPEFAPPPGLKRSSEAGMVVPVCYLVDIQLTDGTPLTLALGSPPMVRVKPLVADPVYLSLLLVCIGALAFVVALWAGRPLRQLADAADELGRNLAREPLKLHGPFEVRRAAQAFNVMQKRLQRHLTERTHMLAAITHDLQTPLTRLRLRLENVEDDVMRERLIGDLAAMNALVQEGLELARSATSTEHPVELDLDSLLESIVEDAAEMGGDAVFQQGCGATLMLRPLSTQRLFSNLIDNALKYGNKVCVSAQAKGQEVAVYIRDEGPGLTEDELEQVFEPFVRLETSRSRQTGGAGLGLTIARALAENNQATVTLQNRPEGGLEAIVRWVSP